MKLLYAVPSPFARKVLVAAHEISAIGKLELVTTLVSPTGFNPAVAQSNPLGKVPVLVLDDGSALYDSRVIAEYLDTTWGAGQLFPVGAARWQALRCQALADGILDAAVLLRYEAVLRPEAIRWQDWVDGQWRKIRAALDAIEQDPGALSGPLTIGQISVACALGYLDFRFGHEDWRSARPNAAAFHEAFAQRPSMKATAPD